MNYDDEKESGQMKVLVVEPLKEPYMKTISDNLKSLQHEVGGGIEAVFPFEDPVAVILNSEGEFNGLMSNRGFYNSKGRLTDIFVGTFLITGLSEDDFGSISEELAEKYTEKYKIPERILHVNGEYIIEPVSDGKGKESETQPDNSIRSGKMKDGKSAKRSRSYEER